MAQMEQALSGIQANAPARKRELSLDGKPQTLADVVYVTMLEAIVDQVLRPGERLTETGVAERLHVSKTPVREVLLRLREIGLVQPLGARGNQVVRPSPVILRHAYETRIALEGFTAEKSSKTADPSQSQLIRRAAEQSLESAQIGDMAGFHASDRAFHRAIAHAAANPRITKAIDDAVALIQTLRRRDIQDTHDTIECGHAHVQIARAINRGDSVRAFSEMREHIRNVEEYTVRNLSTSTEEADPPRKSPGELLDERDDLPARR